MINIIQKYYRNFGNDNGLHLWITVYPLAHTQKEKKINKQ
jgi:hypothetical protein